jgi:hypothetical protein
MATVIALAQISDSEGRVLRRSVLRDKGSKLRRLGTWCLELAGIRTSTTCSFKRGQTYLN